MNFESMKLSELTVNGRGCYGIGASAVEKSDELYTYLRITDIYDDGTLNKAGLKSVDDPDAEKYLLKPNDIVFARTGNSVGKSYFYDERDGVFVYAGFLIKFSLDPTKVNPRFVKYYCQSQRYKDWVASFSTGSTRGNINAQTYGDMEILTPCRAQQDFLVEILSALDDKIELNRRVNANLEQQAAELYRERYETVAFDAKPKEWRVATLGEVAVIGKTTFNPHKSPEILLEHYSIPAFDETRFPVFEMSSAIKSNKFVVDESCFLISKLNPTTKRVWRPYCVTENAVCSTEFIVYKAKKEQNAEFLFAVINSATFSDFMRSHVTGSTGSRQRTTPSETLAFEFLLPTETELVEYQALVAPLYEQIKNNAIESANLKTLRDALLPRLMSGEIDVSDVSL